MLDLSSVNRTLHLQASRPMATSRGLKARRSKRAKASTLSEGGSESSWNRDA